MRFPVQFFLLAAFASTALLASAPAAVAGDARLETLMARPLPDLPGKEALVLTVDYPPGGSSPVHRHEAHAFVYVLEGSIVMGVKGGQEVTLVAGQTFYEGPGDIHTVSRNASATRPAKFLVVMVKGQGVPPVLPVK